MKITEHRLVATSLSLVGLHLVEENYLLPADGMSPFDHLASGLVPLAALAAVAALYGRLRAGLRAGVALTVGAVSASTGFPAVYGIAGDGGIDVSGLAALAAGLALVATGPVVLWRARRRGGSRRRRYLLRAGSAGIALVAAPILLLLVVAPIAFAYGYTHIGRTSSSQDKVALPHERVTIRTSDGIDLAAAYVPSRNGAAVVVFPGAAALKEGTMLARNGYGVLFLDPRGQGRSSGDNVRWAGDRDLIAAAEYLQGRPEVDDDRVAGFGSSVGGEILIEAAARSDAFAAVVSEGAGWRIGYADLDGAESVLFAPIMASLTAATTVFSNHGAPPDIVDRIGLIAPRPVFLIYADPGMGGEAESQRDYYAAAGEPKELWLVPGAEHTGGIDARPREFERRVVAFLDRSLAR